MSFQLALELWFSSNICITESPSNGPGLSQGLDVEYAVFIPSFLPFDWTQQNNTAHNAAKAKIEEHRERLEQKSVYQYYAITHNGYVRDTSITHTCVTWNCSVASRWAFQSQAVFTWACFRLCNCCSFTLIHPLTFLLGQKNLLSIWFGLLCLCRKLRRVLRSFLL